MTADCNAPLPSLRMGFLATRKITMGFARFLGEQKARSFSRRQAACSKPLTPTNGAIRIDCLSDSIWLIRQVEEWSDIMFSIWEENSDHLMRGIFVRFDNTMMSSSETPALATYSLASNDKHPVPRLPNSALSLVVHWLHAVLKYPIKPHARKSLYDEIRTG